MERGGAAASRWEGEQVSWVLREVEKDPHCSESLELLHERQSPGLVRPAQGSHWRGRSGRQSFNDLVGIADSVDPGVRLCFASAGTVSAPAPPERNPQRTGP